MATVEEVLVSFRADIGDLKSKVAQVERSMATVSTATEQAGSALSKLASIGKGIIGAAIIAKIGHELMNLAQESIQVAARVEEMNIVLENLASQNHKTRREVMSTVEAIKDLGITTSVAQNVVAQGTRLGIGMADVTKLARAAQDFAVLSGQDSSATLQRLIYGIITRQSEVLRTAGVQVLPENAFKAYAKQLGIGVKELTETQKTQALLNAVLAEGVKVTGTYETAMESAGKQQRSLARHVEETKLAIGRELLPAFGVWISLQTQVITGIREMVEQGGVLHPIIEKIGDIAEGTMLFLASLGDDQGLRDLGAAAADLVVSLLDLYAAAQPTLELLTMASLTGATAVLIPIIQAFSELARVLAENEVLVKALGYAFAAYMGARTISRITGALGLTGAMGTGMMGGGLAQGSMLAGAFLPATAKAAGGSGFFGNLFGTAALGYNVSRAAGAGRIMSGAGMLGRIGGGLLLGASRVALPAAALYAGVSAMQSNAAYDQRVDAARRGAGAFYRSTDLAERARSGALTVPGLAQWSRGRGEIGPGGLANALRYGALDPTVVENLNRQVTRPLTDNLVEVVSANAELVKQLRENDLSTTELGKIIDIGAVSSRTRATGGFFGSGVGLGAGRETVFDLGGGREIALTGKAAEDFLGIIQGTGEEYNFILDSVSEISSEQDHLIRQQERWKAWGEGMKELYANQIPDSLKESNKEMEKMMTLITSKFPDEDISKSLAEWKQHIDGIAEGFASMLPPSLVTGILAIGKMIPNPDEEARKKTPEIQVFAGDEGFPGLTIADIQTWSDETLGMYDKWTQQVQELIGRGLDPAIITQMLTAGPEQSQPLIDAIMGDTSGKAIEMINEVQSRIASFQLGQQTLARAIAITMEAPWLSLQDAIKAANVQRVLVETGWDIAPQLLAEKAGVALEELPGLAPFFQDQLTAYNGLIDDIKNNPPLVDWQIADLGSLLGAQVPPGIVIPVTLDPNANTVTVNVNTNDPASVARTVAWNESTPTRPPPVDKRSRWE